jgi:CRP/FNR family cyclic AMP-dependent transcriptional regulator
MADDLKLPFELEAFLAKTDEERTISCYQKDQPVFSQGEIADSVFYIQKGRVKITVVSEQKKEAIVAILEAGDFCGEGCLGGQPLRMATAVALGDCKIARLEKSLIIKFLHVEPEFSEKFISHLLARQIRVEADLVDQLFNSSERRLARLLVILAKFGNEGKHVRVIPKLSQETLAEMIGTSRARVNFFMNKFRQMGLIEYNGDDLKIHSSLLDVILHDDPHIKS